MEKKKYRGVVVPMVTPVTKEGTLDKEAVKKIICFFAENGVSPLLMGTTGEGNSVSSKTGRLLVEAAVKAAAGRIKIYAGLTGNCFDEQLQQAEAYCQAGADVIVATLPFYYALTNEQMIGYYRTLADNVKKPLMLYNILATTHMSIPLEAVRLLADHPNIVGLKDSERDLDRMAECVGFSKEREDFSYFCGCAAHSAQALQLGADGIVPSGGNFMPSKYQQLYESAINDDMATAMKMQEETDEIAKIYQKGYTLGQSLAALKVMMQCRGLCQPWMLMPLSRLSEEEEQAITQKAVMYLDK